MGDESLTMEGNDGGVVEDFFGALPEGFVAHALALTSPRDACRLSLVDSVFRSAANWDAVWESFLPPEYQKITEEAVDGGDGSKRKLYLRLCDHPLIIDGGDKINGAERNVTCWPQDISQSFGVIRQAIGDGSLCRNQDSEKWQNLSACVGLKFVARLLRPCYRPIHHMQLILCSSRQLMGLGSNTSLQRLLLVSVGSNARVAQCIWTPKPGRGEDAFHGDVLGCLAEEHLQVTTWYQLHQRTMFLNNEEMGGWRLSSGSTLTRKAVRAVNSR